MKTTSKVSVGKLPYSNTTRSAIRKYGLERCQESYRLNRIENISMTSIGVMLGTNRNGADAAVAAGCEILRGDK